VGFAASYCPDVDTPSPEWGASRWARYRAREIRARFWVGAAVFSLIVAFIVSRVPLPTHPTATQNLIASVLAVIGATVLTGVISYAYALVAAPYQQRNALRAQMSVAAATIAAQQATPVSQTHGDRLRRIAGDLQDCLRLGNSLNYGADGPTWRRAFHEHFPDLRRALEAADEADTAFVELKERLENEVAAAGLNAPPWTPEEFLPILGTTIQSRAVTRILGAPYDFDWHEIGPGAVNWGDLYDGWSVLQGADPADVPDLEARFQEFFRRAESLPEAADLRDKCAARASAVDMALDLLASAANTDPITTRCSLCRGSGSA
jgi:hypothetical protein